MHLELLSEAVQTHQDQTQRHRSASREEKLVFSMAKLSCGRTSRGTFRVKHVTCVHSPVCREPRGPPFENPKQNMAAYLVKCGSSAVGKEQLTWRTLSKTHWHGRHDTARHVPHDTWAWLAPGSCVLGLLSSCEGIPPPSYCSGLLATCASLKGAHITVRTTPAT